MQEFSLILSAGSVLAFLSLFYQFNKDSNATSAKMANLETRLVHIENESISIKTDITKIKDDIHNINIALTRIETKLSNIIPTNPPKNNQIN